MHSNYIFFLNYNTSSLFKSLSYISLLVVLVPSGAFLTAILEKVMVCCVVHPTHEVCASVAF